MDRLELFFDSARFETISAWIIGIGCLILFIIYLWRFQLTRLLVLLLPVLFFMVLSILCMILGLGDSKLYIAINKINQKMLGGRK
jgi:hypothetical protein